MIAADRSPGASTLDTTAQRKNAFLEAYKECGVIRHACDGSGIGRSTVYAWIDDDPEFLPRLRSVHSQVLDVLETALFRRGVVGWEEPVYQSGRLVGSSRRYSDACLIFALKAADPAKYRERYDVTSGGQPLIKVYSGFDLSEVGAGDAPKQIEAKVIDHELPAKRQRTRKDKG